MIMGTRKQVCRGMIHWLWLWMLATIVISVLHSVVRGESLPAPQPVENLSLQSNSMRFPMHGVDRLDLVRQPLGITETENATLRDVLQLNRRGEYKGVIKVWEQLDIMPESVSWMHVGIGAAHLRLENLDRALEQLNRAIEVDPSNAVAEYFLGRVYTAKSRQVPFWYEPDEESPFRLVGWNTDQRAQDRGDVFLPNFKTLPFDRQAKFHYRRSIRLATDCDLDRTIDYVQPKLRLISQGFWNGKPITVRDLLISLNEEDYVEKARLEVHERFVRGE